MTRSEYVAAIEHALDIPPANATEQKLALAAALTNERSAQQVRAARAIITQALRRAA